MKKRILIFLLLITASCAYGQKYMFVFLKKKQNPEPITKEQSDKIMDGHMANINRLAKENKLKAAGPFEGGGGLFIFLSDSKQQVEEWLSTDPGVQAKRWDVEILPYTPRTGSVCSVGEPYQMTMYTFVRYGINQSKDTFGDLTTSLKEHNDYLKKLIATGNVVTEATFGDTEGGILVVKGDISKEVIEQDPSVQNQTVSADFKQLYIAKGSFCEK
ncbi:hypothetical protein BH09BAC3_BH09BAC3_16650 [soil metagenome]